MTDRPPDSKTTKRVLVCGSRDYANWPKVQETLDAIHAVFGISHILHGAATSADSLADRWAREHKVEQTPFDADWDAHGRAAGPIRNRKMLEEGRPDLVIAFAGKKGTRNMVDQAAAAGVEVRLAAIRLMAMMVLILETSDE